MNALLIDKIIFFTKSIKDVRQGINIVSANVHIIKGGLLKKILIESMHENILIKFARIIVEN